MLLPGDDKCASDVSEMEAVVVFYLLRIFCPHSATIDEGAYDTSLACPNLGVLSEHAVLAHPLEYETRHSHHRNRRITKIP